MNGKPLPKNKWVVTYNTSRACLPGGQIAATVQPVAGQKPPRKNEGTSVVFRVTDRNSRATVYEKSARTLPNGRATLTLPATGAFASQGREAATSLACSIQAGTAARTAVACPTLPKCRQPDPTPSPSASPTHIDSMAPTVSPSHYDSVEPTVSPTHIDSMEPTLSPTHYDSMEPTASPTHMDSLEPTAAPPSDSTREPTGALYDVLMESGPAVAPPSCLDAYLKVTVLRGGRPVKGRKVSLLVIANWEHPDAAQSRIYKADGITDADGVVTLLVTLDPADQGDDSLSVSLKVNNPLFPFPQYAVPALNFGC